MMPGRRHGGRAITRRGAAVVAIAVAGAWLAGCDGSSAPRAAATATTTAPTETQPATATTPAAPGGPVTPAPAARAATARPALCGRLRARVAGRVASPAATELSGLAFSRSQNGVLWTHNDSGNRPRLLAITTRGTLLADVTVGGAENVDWEDVATGPQGALYIGDIGDNAAARPSVVVYRVAEPRVRGAGVGAAASAAAAAPAVRAAAGADVLATEPAVRAAAGADVLATAPAVRFELRYPDGARDAEALLVDRATGALTIVTKSPGGRAGVYAARGPSPSAVTTLRRTGTIDLGAAEAVTAASLSATGRTIALRSYDAAFVWRRRAGESIASALRRRPACQVDADLLPEGQGEAIALAPGGTAFYTLPEGPRPALRRYERARRVS